MQFRHILLALGFLALVAGIGLTVVSLRTSRSPAVAGRQLAAPEAQVLVAARDLPVATLLRSDDVKWVALPPGKMQPGAVQQGKGPDNLLGSATEHEFKAGDPITIDGIIRPTDARFLRAVLAPGLRALSLSFGEPQLGAGLIQPGDHVDILLTQTLSDATGPAYRSVGETILSNVRVIAADQTHLQPPPDNPQHLQLATKKPVPHIVTLEVTPKQAEMLMVAQRLGSMQLTLRGLVDKGDSGVVPPPAWAAEVSPALGAAGDNGGGTQTAGGPNSGPVAVDIFRGTKSEQRCFSESTGMHVNCGKGASSPAKAAEPPAGNQPGDSQPAPKASRIAPAPAAHRV